MPIHIRCVHACAAATWQLTAIYACLLILAQLPLWLWSLHNTIFVYPVLVYLVQCGRRKLAVDFDASNMTSVAYNSACYIMTSNVVTLGMQSLPASLCLCSCQKQPARMILIEQHASLQLIQ